MTDTTRLFGQIVAIPQIARGQVWCRTCGYTQRVDGAGAMRNGWPKCCRQTMTIDSPDEQKQLASIGGHHAG